jgi:hypothetical protein
MVIGGLVMVAFVEMISTNGHWVEIISTKATLTRPPMTIS